MHVDRTKIFIGMGGWDLEPFDRVFYPPGTKRGFRKLEYYSQFFDSVEIHSSFYSTALTPIHARRWLRDIAANKHFLFSSVKLFRGFTHTGTADQGDVLATHRLLEPLAAANRLGGLLIQFPYSFTNIRERRLYLMELARVFQPYRLFVEVRHNSWNSPMMYNFFQENKLHLVNIDVPAVGRAMPLTDAAWNGVAYFRLMGRNAAAGWDPTRGYRSDYCYNDRELQDLAWRLKRAEQSSTTVYVSFNNDGGTCSFINGFQLRHLLRSRHPVLVPDRLVKTFPILQPISTPVNILHPLFTSHPEER
jgi:uncharacterized protein YecE (DUF72 family)